VVCAGKEEPVQEEEGSVHGEGEVGEEESGGGCYGRPLSLPVTRTDLQRAEAALVLELAGKEADEDGGQAQEGAGGEVGEGAAEETAAEVNGGEGATTVSSPGATVESS
jgi:hypothetical protein